MIHRIDNDSDWRHCGRGSVREKAGGSNSCRPGKRSKNDSARDNLTWSSHRTLLMRLMCLGRNELGQSELLKLRICQICLFSVTLNRDWDRLRYHRRHTEDRMNWEVLDFWHVKIRYLYPTNIDLDTWRSIFDAGNSSVELFAHGCQSQLLPLVSITQAAFASYDGWQDGECPFFEYENFDYFQNVSCCTISGRCDNNNRRQKVINGEGKASVSFIKRIMVIWEARSAQKRHSTPR